jgi:hypothetical protein
VVIDGTTPKRPIDRSTFATSPTGKEWVSQTTSRANSGSTRPWAFPSFRPMPAYRLGPDLQPGLQPGVMIQFKILIS